MNTRLTNPDYRAGYLAGLNAAWFEIMKAVKQGELPPDEAIRRAGYLASTAIILDLIRTFDPPSDRRADVPPPPAPTTVRKGGTHP